MLRVVTKEFKGGKHGQAAVVKFLGLGFGIHFFDTLLVGQCTRTAVGGELEINETNEGNDLSPTKSRDGLNGGNTVGDGRARKARSNVDGETVCLRGNVT